MQIYKEEYQDPFRKDCTSKFDLNTCAGFSQLQKQQKPKLLNVGLTTKLDIGKGRGSSSNRAQARENLGF